MVNPSTEIPATVVLPPQTALQMGGASLHTVAAALGTQPLLLVIVLLNMTFAGIAGYFMLQLEQYRAQNLQALITLVTSCVLETAPLATLQSSTVQYQSEVERLRGVIDDMRRERGEAVPEPPP